MEHPAPEDYPVNPVRHIGPFALAEFIGEGDGTKLYRAIRPHGARPPYEVCIRVANDPVDPDVGRAIRSEYETLRAMDNPRIPRAYGHYPDESALAMSYYAGATLADVIQARNDGLINLSISSAIDVVIEIAHGIRHAHSMTGPNGEKIVHGHLGPQRVRLTPNGNLVLVGFGCKPRGRHPAYTAPEVANGDPASPQSDQWTLGAIMVELILGERLYADTANVNEAVREGDVAYWIQRVSERHPELGETLRTMLAPEPQRRFKQNHELLKALLTAGRKIGGTVNRRSLASSVMSHGHRLSKVRPEKSTLNSASFSESPVPATPTTVEEYNPASLPGVEASLPTEHPWAKPKTVETPGPSSIPPAPEPAPRFLPSEIAGTVLGSLMLALGATYVFLVL